MRQTIIRMLLLLACLAGGWPALSAAEVVVIAHAQVSQSSLTRAELKSIYLGKKNLWSDDNRITLTVLRSGTVHDSFIRGQIAMSPGRFDRFWKQQVFTGRARMPSRCESEKELITLVASTPGAIGYVSATALEGSTGIKQIAIE